jgi:tRNA(Ile)-lysidine synthase
LLPELERDWNPALREVLARTANVAQDEEAYWEEKMNGLEAELLREEPLAVLLDCSVLKKLHRAIARRAIRRAIERVKGDLRRIDSLHVERLLSLALSGRGEGRTQLPGLLAVRSFEVVRLAPPGAWPTEEDYSFPVKVPGRYVLPDSKSVISLAFADVRESSDQSIGGYNTREVAILDWKMIRGPLILRNWRPGDQFQPAGNRRPRKLKALFQGDRIPSWDRVGWPMLSLGGSIVWAQRFGVAAEYAAKPGCSDGVRVWKSLLADGP